MAVVEPLFDLVSIFGEINNCVLGNQNSLATIDVAPTGQHDAARRENTNSRFLWSLANQFDGVIAAACPSIQNKRLDFCTHDQHHFAICDGITMRRLSVESNTILRMLMLAHRRAAGRSTTHFYEYPPDENVYKSAIEAALG